MKIKDERVKAMNEILNGIKIIKLYGWEQAFINNIKTTRSNELKMLKKINYIEALLMAIWNVAPMLVSFITFALYVLLDSNHVLTPARAFVSLALFNILRFPLVMLPSLVTLIIMVGFFWRKGKGGPVLFYLPFPLVLLSVSISKKKNVSIHKLFWNTRKK